MGFKSMRFTFPWIYNYLPCIFLGVLAEMICRLWYVLEIAHIRTNNKVSANSTAKDVRWRAIFTPSQTGASGTLPQEEDSRAYSSASLFKIGTFIRLST
jgi:hypothetical protein